jgi:hypothetical protein
VAGRAQGAGPPGLGVGDDFALFAIVAFTGYAFGLFYVVLMAALGMFVAVSVLAVPPINRKFESLSTAELTQAVAAVILTSLLLAVLYSLFANGLGFTLRFGPV